jgi:hypothetical protein
MIFTDHKETPFFMRSVLMRSRVRLLFEKYLKSHVFDFALHQQVHQV